MDEPDTGGTGGTVEEHLDRLEQQVALLRDAVIGWLNETAAPGDGSRSAA